MRKGFVYFIAAGAMLLCCCGCEKSDNNSEAASAAVSSVVSQVKASSLSSSSSSSLSSSEKKSSSSVSSKKAESTSSEKPQSKAALSKNTSSVKSEAVNSSVASKQESKTESSKAVSKAEKKAESSSAVSSAIASSQPQVTEEITAQEEPVYEEEPVYVEEPAEPQQTITYYSYTYDVQTGEIIDDPIEQNPEIIPPAPSENGYIEEVCRLINEAREKEGLDPVQLDAPLCNAAQKRSKELIEKEDHIRPNGDPLKSIFTEFNIGQTTYGENIASGQETPSDVVNAWLNSDAHRVNIMNPAFHRMGVGYTFDKSTERVYFWSQLFTN